MRDLAPQPSRPTTNWSIGLMRAPDIAGFATAATPSRPIISEHDLTALGGVMAADPFAIKVDGVWQVFFEMVTRHAPDGVIATACSRDLITWEPQGTVLDTGSHLLYPFVFEHQGGIFMMPESKRTREIAIYEATAFPRRWKHVRTIIRGRYFDASLVHYDNRFWLFAGCLSYGLRVFHAAHPLGPWRPHAWPFLRCYAPAAARPGGRPIVEEGRLIRFAQDNQSHYGHQLRAWHVTRLSPFWFAETPLLASPLLRPAGHGWNGRCMHHIDPHPLPEGGFVAFVDGCP